MKKKLFTLSGVFLIALVIAGLWATKAVNFTEPQNTTGADPVNLTPGITLKQMAEGATAIVHGKCTGTQSRWDDRRLVTDVTIEVTESLKGGAGEIVTVETPGGIGNKGRFALAMTYPGAPQFSPNEEVFLFLNNSVDGSNNYTVMGYDQGKFSVNTDTEGGKVVMREMNTTPVQRGAGTMRGNHQAISLSEFKKMVESFLNK